MSNKLIKLKWCFLILTQFFYKKIKLFLFLFLVYQIYPLLFILSDYINISKTIILVSLHILIGEILFGILITFYINY
jgi:hypothetical protein